MTNIFDISTTFFTLWGYQMSYIEFFGTIFNIWCVWLAARNKISTWPVGIFGVVLYIFLFYQIQLYSDLIEQLYFLITSFYGWWLWLRINKEKMVCQEKKKNITYNNYRTNIKIVVGIILATLGLSYFMNNIHLYFPKLFSIPASYPFFDAFTTVMSFLAQFLLTRKKIENWYLWIIVDIIGVILYFIKDVKFISLEYLIFLGMAIKGLIDWRKQYKKDNKINL